MEISLYSWQGINTKDNRDVIEYVHSKCGNATLFIVLDGATATPRSGQFCRQLAELLKEKFKIFNQRDLADDQALRRALEESRQELSREFCGEYASLLLVVVAGEAVLTVAVGDCCLGVLDNQSQLVWLTGVHTLAGLIEHKTISELKLDTKRHVLTRSFKAKRFVELDVGRFNVDREQQLLIATDGFWSLDESTQFKLLKERVVNFETSDDASVIVVKRPPQGKCA